MVTPKGDHNVVRRSSSRLQEQQRLEKERLVRRRVELLGKDDDDQGEVKRSKREGATNTDLEAASKALEEIHKINSNSNSNSNGGRSKRSAVRLNATAADDLETTGITPHLKVREALRAFNKHYLQIFQEEQIRCGGGGVKSPKKSNSKKKADESDEPVKRKANRADLKAVTKMMNNHEILYREKRIGAIPGVDVGHQFYSRTEMIVVGLHSHWLNGIDYKGQNCSKASLKDYKGCKLPLAVSIVLSGMYEDDLDKAEEVIYTGQGGHDLKGNKRQIKDQKLERGNLALKNCIEAGVPVRVTRGHDSGISYTKRCYTYDGLYNVKEYWAEKGLAGFTVYKFRLKRCEGQPILTTSQVNFINGKAPQSISELRGLVCKDISGGQEKIPIPATNLIDDPPFAPTGFKYRKNNVVAKNVKIPKAAAGCNCKGPCTDAKTCACAKLNGSVFPYVQLNGGRLVEARDVVFECGPHCGCPPECVNRTSQGGLKYRLEVFATSSKGFGVKSWDFIPSGAPVCEYTGKLMRTEDLDNVSENNYIFEIDCLQTMKGIGGRERRLRDVSIQNLEKGDEQRSENAPEFCIDAGVVGNIARFINHSCEPNLFVQCVFDSHHDPRLAKVMLFAADNIPPLQELTYDYGYALDSVHGPDGKIIQVPCHCGAAACRKRLL